MNRLFIFQNEFFHRIDDCREFNVVYVHGLSLILFLADELWEVAVEISDRDIILVLILRIHILN